MRRTPVMNLGLVEISSQQSLSVEAVRDQTSDRGFNKAPRFSGWSCWTIACVHMTYRDCPKIYHMAVILQSGTRFSHADVDPDKTCVGFYIALKNGFCSDIKREETNLLFRY